MERFHHLHTVVHRDSPGIEIGPWRHPVAPKREGYRTLVIDVLDTEELRAMARKRNLPDGEISLIEDVDIVGDGSNLHDLVRGRGFGGRFAWIVSCHNFEHLPDPVRFLRDCEQLLEPGGALAMIVPDKRYSIDRFQPPATVAEMLRAWIGGRGQDESAWERFKQKALKSHLVDAAGRRRKLWSRRTSDAGTILVDDPRHAFAQLGEELSAAMPPESFLGHRWRFTPAVFELMILDLRALGIVSMEAETFPADGVEFSAILRTCEPWHPTGEEYVARRSALCRRIEDEAAVVSGVHAALVDELNEALAEIARLRAAAIG